MSEKKTKEFNYKEWAEAFMNFVESKAQHDMSEDLRLTLLNLDPMTMIYEPALTPAAHAWATILASAAIQVTDSMSKAEKAHGEAILNYIAKKLGVARLDYDRYMVKAQRVYDGFMELERGVGERVGDLGLDTGCLAMDLQFDIYDDMSPEEYHTTPASLNDGMDGVFERYNLPRLRAAAVYVPLVSRFVAIAYDWIKIGRGFADKHMFSK